MNGDLLTPPAETSTAPAASPLRAWCALVGFCFQRQARARQMVWIALALLGFTAALVALNTAAGRWHMDHWRWRWVEERSRGPTFSTGFTGGAGAIPAPAPPPREMVLNYGQTRDALELLPLVGAWSPGAIAVEQAFAGAVRAVLAESDFFVFSNWVVFASFLSFLLPIWSLSFATEALGSEREERSLVWLLTRPLPRSSIYLAKFIALLPWTLGLNLGGFALLCMVAGRPGYRALQVYGPAVFWATLAFASLFHLMAACFRRPALVALVYSFFLETILGNMPGTMKRISIGFYARCIMFEGAEEYGIYPVKQSVYLPVSSATATVVLAAATLGLLGLGMFVFGRSEYQDIA